MPPPIYNSRNFIMLLGSYTVILTKIEHCIISKTNNSSTSLRTIYIISTIKSSVKTEVCNH